MAKKSADRRDVFTAERAVKYENDLRSLADEYRDIARLMEKSGPLAVDGATQFDRGIKLCRKFAVKWRSAIDMARIQR